MASRTIGFWIAALSQWRGCEPGMPRSGQVKPTTALGFAKGFGLGAYGAFRVLCWGLQGLSISGCMSSA